MDKLKQIIEEIEDNHNPIKDKVNEMFDILFTKKDKKQEILDENEYQDYFRSKLKQFGVTSPAQLDKEGKSKFFNSLKKGWRKKKRSKK